MSTLYKHDSRHNRRWMAVTETVARMNSEREYIGLPVGYKVGFIGDVAYVALADPDVTDVTPVKKERERLVKAPPKKERIRL